MTSKQVFLQQKDIVRFNALVGKLAEARVDAVDRPAFCHELLHAFASAHNVPARFARERQRMDSPQEYPFGVVERQIVAGKDDFGIGTPQNLTVEVSNYILPGVFYNLDPWRKGEIKVVGAYGRLLHVIRLQAKAIAKSQLLARGEDRRIVHQTASPLRQCGERIGRDYAIVANPPSVRASGIAGMIENGEFTLLRDVNPNRRLISNFL